MSDISVVIGPETVRSYKRLSYELWWALAEFVDNSTQSYFSNRTELDKSNFEKNERLEVLIAYDRQNNFLRISDNAMGMSLEDLQNALVIGSPPVDSSGRHEFGLGMKTAACWLGDRWRVRTSKLGSKFEHQIEFDVERVANGDTDVRLQSLEASPDKHYTVIEIENLHQKIAGRQLGRLKENLRSIYRFDTRSGDLILKWGDEELLYEDGISLLRGRDGVEYKKDFEFDVNGKRVYGWGGILESGGRPKAGFAIARRGRLVVGQPDAWRPQSIFGQLTGSNDLVNQRIVGEIHLDDFLISHTKNQILWQGEELEIVEAELKEKFADFKHTAQNRRVKGEGGPSQHLQEVAISQIKEIVSSPDFADLVNIREVPAPELVEASFKPMRDSIASSTPDDVFVIGNLTVNLFIDSERSPNDPYFFGDYSNDNQISVCINSEHRFWKDWITSADQILIYVINCIFDAIAEWKCMQKNGSIEPDTVKLIKDGLMRESFTKA